MSKTLILLANGFEAVEASVFTDVLGWNKWEGDGSTDAVTVGLHSQLQCTWNFTVTPEALISEISLDDFDALAIPGGFEEADFYVDGFSEEFQQIIRHFDTHKKPIATICVAALTVANSGVLTGRKATTYQFPESIRLQQLHDFGVDVQTERIVIDDNIITSGNPGTAFDVAFLLLEKLTSTENCQRVKERMGF